MASHPHLEAHNNTPSARSEAPHHPPLHERTAADLEIAQQLGHLSQQRDVALPSIHHHLAQQTDNQDDGLVWGRSTPGLSSHTPARPYQPPAQATETPESILIANRTPYTNTSPEPATSGQECRYVRLELKVGLDADILQQLSHHTNTTMETFSRRQNNL